MKENKVVNLKKLKNNFGGFHLGLKKGERIEIKHGEETLVIQMNGKQGVDQFGISILGPHSFKIIRDRWIMRE